MNNDSLTDVVHLDLPEMVSSIALYNLKHVMHPANILTQWNKDEIPVLRVYYDNVEYNIFIIEDKNITPVHCQKIDMFNDLYISTESHFKVYSYYLNEKEITSHQYKQLKNIKLDDQVRVEIKDIKLTPLMHWDYNLYKEYGVFKTPSVDKPECNKFVPEGEAIILHQYFIKTLKIDSLYNPMFMKRIHTTNLAEFDFYIRTLVKNFDMKSLQGQKLYFEKIEKYIDEHPNHILT